MHHLRVRLAGAANHRDDRHGHGEDGPRQRELVLDSGQQHGPAVRTDARLAYRHHLLHGGDLYLCVVVHEPALSVHGEHHVGVLGLVQGELVPEAPRV